MTIELRKKPVFFTRLVKRGETLSVVEEKKFDESLKGFLKVDLSRTKLHSFLTNEKHLIKKKIPPKVIN